MNKDDLAGYRAGLLVKDIAPTKPIEGLIVMPQKVDASNGTGYYSHDAATTFKELKALGYNPAYYTEKRAALYLNSADEFQWIEFLLGFFVQGMGSSAAWDGIKALINLRAGKRANPRVRAKIYINSRSANIDTWQEYDLNGTVDEAMKMIDKIREQHENDKSPTKKEI